MTRFLQIFSQHYITLLVFVCHFILCFLCVSIALALCVKKNFASQQHLTEKDWNLSSLILLSPNLPLQAKTFSSMLSNIHFIVTLNIKLAKDPVTPQSKALKRSSLTKNIPKKYYIRVCGDKLEMYAVKIPLKIQSIFSNNYKKKNMH